jgi:hypothetical protein
MRFFLSTLLITLATIGAFGQNSKNKLSLVEGTRYMVAFPQVWASPSEKPLPQPMQLFISSKVKTTVKVETPSTINDNARINREYTINANEVLKIPIATSYMTGMSASGPDAQTKRGYGIYITSKNPISVSTYQAWMGNGELARHLPIDAWGKNYFTMNFYQDRYGTSGQYKYRPSQILLISARDNTVVTYTPTWTTEGGSDNPSASRGEAQTITLNKGETYTIKSKIDENFNKEWNTDLSGTIISSNKTLGVVSGHTKVAIMRYPDVLPPTGIFSAEAHFVRNNVHDAMLPVEMAGTKFVTLPCLYTPTRVVGQGSVEFGIDDDRGDVVRVVAIEDNTKVSSMRQDGSSLKPERTLRKGESFLATSLEVATYWETDKPALVCHYGKSYAKILPPALVGKNGGDQPQGHPTVESGMPMMQYVPSVDRWASYGVFSSPEGMDNFLNIVFKTTQVGQIKIDGRSLTSAFGGSTRQIKGTDYSYIRTPIGAGNHVIESNVDSIKWAAWTYGSLDGLQQGRAYGTPIAIDLAIPCDDSLDIKYQIVCGNVEGEVKLLPENSQCAKFFAFIVDNSSNYAIEADIDNLTEYTVFPFKLKVLDKKLPAYAKVRVITRSGNWIEKEFVYDGINLVFYPESVNLGTHAIGDTVCSSVTVTNNSSVSITIDELCFSKSEFWVSPSTLILQPKESKTIDICGTVKTPIATKDTLVAKINCSEIQYIAVEIRGDEPVFYAGDQHWGNIPANDKQTKTVTLINTGKASVTVTDYTPKSNGYFTNTTLVNYLPLTIKPGERFVYNVDYSPNGEVSTLHTMKIQYAVNTSKEKLYSDLSGLGTDGELSISSATWIERVLDKYQTTKAIAYYKNSVVLKNIGNARGVIKGIIVDGKDASSFEIVNSQTLYDDIQPNSSRTIEIHFIPQEQPNRSAERTYSANVTVLYTVNGIEKTTSADLEATALQPYAVATDQTWGTQNTNSRTTLPVTITNINFNQKAPLTNKFDGTLDLIIDSVVIEQNTPFVWSATNSKTYTFTPPLVVGPGLSANINVDFIPNSPGIYKSNYNVYGNISDTVSAVLTGDVKAVGTIDPLYLISWYSIPKVGAVTGNFSYSTVLRFKEFRGNDYMQFNVAQSQQLTDIVITPDVPFSFLVEFTPDSVTKNGLKYNQNLNGRLPFRQASYKTEIVFEDLSSGNEVVGNITADGKYLETTLRIVADKDITVGDNANVNLFLEPRPESIDSGNVISSRLRLKFDNSVVTPTVLNAKSFPSAVYLQETPSTNMVELDIVTNDFQQDGYLGTKSFKTVLAKNRYSNVDGEYYTIDKLDKKGSPYVVFNIIPDIITIREVCANNLRLVGIGSAYGMVVKNNTIEISLGIDAPVTLSSVNELGQETIIYRGNRKAGTHSFTLPIKGLQWIVATQGDWVERIAVYVE